MGVESLGLGRHVQEGGMTGAKNVCAVRVIAATGDFRIESLPHEPVVQTRERLEAMPQPELMATIAVPVGTVLRHTYNTLICCHCGLLYPEGL